MINGGWKAYFGLENNCKSTNLVMWDKKKFLFETLVIPVISMVVTYGGATFLENLGGRLRKSRSCLQLITSKLKAIHLILFSSSMWFIPHREHGYD